MNEIKLKDLFVSSLESDHIVNSIGDPVSFKTPEDEIRIKNKGYFGQFDLVLAIIHRHTKQYEGLRETDLYDNILMRTGQLTEMAKSEKCSIDSISFYLVELKSNCDTLDGRLPNQILNAILKKIRTIICVKYNSQTTSPHVNLVPLFKPKVDKIDNSG